MIEGLLFDEARAIISSLEAVEIENWIAWKDEWPDWRPAGEVEGLTEMIYRAMSVSPPPPRDGDEESGSLKLQKILSDDVEAGIVRLDSVRTDPKMVSQLSADFITRQNRRFKKRYSIQITLDENTLKTFSRDISVGGINVEDNLPEWITGYFRVRIEKPNSRQVVELNCCLVENQEPNDRHRIMILPLQSQEDEKNLETWIAA